LTISDHPRLIGNIEIEPDLSETVRRYFEEQGSRATAVVPLRLGGHWVGILNIAWAQSVIFSGRDRRLYQALLSQTAAVVENRRLIGRTQEALAMAKATERRYTLQAWESYRARQTGGYRVEVITNLDHVAGLPPVDLERVLAEKRPVVVGLIDDQLPDNSQLGGGLLVPLIIRGEVIGLIEIRDQNHPRRWLPEEISIIETIAQQLSQTAESLRLVDESQQRAAREARVNQIGEQIRGAHSLEEALRIAVKEVGLSLQAPQTLVRLAVGE
jgi:GAF domain-containing protein